MNWLQLSGALEIGLIYALIALGIYLTFRIIDFPDLTVDGSFTLGAGLCAMLITMGQSPWLATFAALLAGAAAGIITGYLHTRWNILGLLASIITLTALYSINLRVMGKPNIALLDQPTLFQENYVLLPLIMIVLIVWQLLTAFFRTDMGLAIRAIGSNHKVSKAYGISVSKMKMVALALSNALVALGGALFAQTQGFADIAMGNGTIIMGLAAVIMGESLCRSNKLLWVFLACISGSLLYRVAIALALNTNELGLQASDLNLLTAALVALTMILPKLRRVS